METIIIFCSVCVAIIAYIGVLKQINASIYSSAQFRWDEDLRITVSVLLMEINKTLENSTEIKLNRMDSIYNEQFIKLRLLLDPQKTNEIKLLNTIKSFWDKIEDNEKRDEEFQKLLNETISIYRSIVNDEWKKHKRGYY